MSTIDETGGVGLPNIESRVDLSLEVWCEQESVQGSVSVVDDRDRAPIHRRQPVLRVVHEEVMCYQLR